MKRVLTVGVFDLLHWGHFELFRRAKALAEGGKLVVAVQVDAFVSKFKDVKLVYDWEQRVKMISALRSLTKRSRRSTSLVLRLGRIKTMRGFAARKNGALRMGRTLSFWDARRACPVPGSVRAC